MPHSSLLVSKKTCCVFLPCDRMKFLFFKTVCHSTAERNCDIKLNLVSFVVVFFSDGTFLLDSMMLVS